MRLHGQSQDSVLSEPPFLAIVADVQKTLAMMAFYAELRHLLVGLKLGPKLGPTLGRRL